MGAAGRFSCESCGKSYAWKPELAGRRAKCKCGQPLAVPAEDPALEPAGFDDLYALAEGTPVEQEVITPPPIPRGAACPSCGASTGAGAVLCVSCGHNLKTGKKVKTQKLKAEPAMAGGGGGGGAAGMLAYAGRRPAREGEGRGGDMMFDPVWDMYVPMGFIVLGTVFSYVEVVYGRGISNPGLAMMFVGVFTLINIVLGVPGVLATVKMFDLGLGPVGPALIKIVACLLFPGAVAGLITAFVPMGGMLAWAVSFAITLAMFMKMLGMDYTETVICSVIIWLIRTWLSFALIALLFGGFFMGGGGSGGGGLGGSGGLSMMAGGGFGDEEVVSAKELDAVAAEFVKDAKLVEARAWLAGNEKRVLEGKEHGVSVGIVNDLYRFGAADVSVPFDKDIEDPETNETAMNLVVKLPAGKSARKQLFDFEAKIAEEADNRPEKDVGQKYLILSFW